MPNPPNSPPTTARSQHEPLRDRGHDTLDDVRLRRVSARLAASCAAIAVALPGLVVLDWIASGGAGATSGLAGGAVRLGTASIAFCLAVALTLLPALLLSAAFIAARRALLTFAAGAWFDPVAVRALGAFGRWTVLAGAASLALPTLLGLALSIGAPPGERVLAISISSGAVTAMLTGGVVWALGHVWAQAATLRAELDGFV